MVFMSVSGFGLLLTLFLRVHSGAAVLTGKFEIRSNNPCFKHAALYEEHPNPLETPERCVAGNVSFCDTQSVLGKHHTTIVVTDDRDIGQIKINTYLINICTSEVPPTTKVERFGFALQLYGPRNPFAIQRSFCVGQSPDDCCVFNLCNGVFGRPAMCSTTCHGVEIELSWQVDWNTN
eukprot:m.266233 g.266233  ORF g.266233 m.266233 type:complete len:178 (-) comp66070_c0_seq1:131-664(-)